MRPIYVLCHPQKPPQARVQIGYFAEGLVHEIEAGFCPPRPPIWPQNATTFATQIGKAKWPDAAVADGTFAFDFWPRAVRGFVRDRCESANTCVILYRVKAGYCQKHERKLPATLRDRGRSLFRFRQAKCHYLALARLPPMTRPGNGVKSPEIASVFDLTSESATS